ISAACPGCYWILGGPETSDTSGDSSPTKSSQSSLSVAQLAAGGDYTCVLMQDGGDGAGDTERTSHVLCWGALTPSSIASAPQQVTLPGNARKVVVGDGSSGGHACALLENATVACWGPGIATIDAPSILDLNAVRDIWAGYDHTCAVDDS